MQFELKGILLIICIILAVIVALKVAKKAVKLVLIVVIICAFLVGTNIIDLNTLAPDVQAKVNAVVEVVGDSFIKTSGKDILIKVNDDWYNVSDIAIIGDLATDSVVLKYDDREIYVGETGLVNALRVLERFGLVQSE